MQMTQRVIRRAFVHFLAFAARRSLLLRCIFTLAYQYRADEVRAVVEI